MFVVIFKATIKQGDALYEQTAQRLRKLALDTYDCLDFIAVAEGNQEIALSYWRSETDILKWKQAAEHLVAQTQGKSRWYESYSVEVAAIQRAYSR